MELAASSIMHQVRSEGTIASEQNSADIERCTVAALNAIHVQIDGTQFCAHSKEARPLR